MPLNEEDNLISIDEVIFRAKRLGVDFGKGNPRERLRYLTKIGLLPHAKRKSFNGQPPNGAYPEYVVELLKEIDKEIKAGKSIQQIKREKERRGLLEVSYPFYPGRAEPEFQPPIGKIGKPPLFKKVKIFSLLKIIFLVFLSGGIIFFLTGQLIEKDFSSYLLASFFGWLQRLRPGPALVEEKPEAREIFPPPTYEPYLTINVETDINAPLNVKEKISAPTYFLQKGKFKGEITSLDLTGERVYQFPDLSGVVCLTAGNCFGIFGEVTSPGGIENRLAKFLGEREIGLSSISDFFEEGIVMTIDSTGNVGIGIEKPLYPLHLKGRLQASGDICSDLEGGKCLSQAIFELPPMISGEGKENYLPLWKGPRTLGDSIVSQFDSTLNIAGTLKTLGFEMPTGAASGYVLTSDGRGRASWQPLPPPPAIPPPGIGGAGTVGRLAIWTGSTTLGDSIVSQSGSVLDVEGTIEVSGFRMPPNATSGYILTAIDQFGNAAWLPPPAGTLPSGLFGQTLRHDGTSWVSDFFLYNTGSALGIGTTSTLATLTLSGNAIFTTTTLPQLLLRYDPTNYLKFAIDSSQSLIEASKKMVINSLTGEIKLGDNVNLFDAFGAKIQGATFISAPTDSTVRKSGELVFRASIPIFPFPVPAQTNSPTFVPISKTFSLTDSLNLINPPQLPGTTRVYAFLINFADNIATTSNSFWRVYRPNAATTTFAFQFPGQNLSTLEIGNPYLTATTTLPDNDWRLEVRVPSADKTIRIFNILLLTFDQIN